MRQIFEEQKKQQQTDALEPAQCIAQDTDDVYYKFGGAAIATMLHLRQDCLKSTTDQIK